MLRVRGDYLAIATLGLGEIIRVLVLSDMLRPLLGGAQGIVNIPKPALFGVSLSTPTALFYLTACFTAVAGYVAFRLQHSGLGRRWLAVREDEDVAQALGIKLVKVKLSAYTMGAAFAGLAGGIFAAMVGSVFPQSFQLLVSVNVLAPARCGHRRGGADRCTRGPARPGRIPLPHLRPGDHRRRPPQARGIEPQGDPPPRDRMIARTVPAARA